MRLLHYTFFAVLGAAAGAWATQRFWAVAPAEGRAPLVVYLPAPEAPAASVAPVAGEVEARAKEAELAKAALAEELAGVREELARTRENLAELRRPMDADVRSSALRAELKSGEVVVTGGYRLSDGTRAYAFVQPVVVRENGSDFLRVTGVLRAVDDDTGAAVGLDALATNADNTLQHGEVWVEDERRVVFEALDRVQAPAAVELPGVNVEMGRQARIAVGDTSIQVRSALGADGETLDFEVRLEQAKPAGGAEKGAVSDGGGAPQ